MAHQTQLLATPCESLEADLVLLHYGELAGMEVETVRSHVNGCSGCDGYLRDLGKLMPLTIKSDEPPQTFWTDYNRELRYKIAATETSWWRSLSVVFQLRWLPALATAAVVVLAMTFTIGKGIWPNRVNLDEDSALIEALPVAENLEFFKTMEVLDDLELLEFMSSQGNGNA